ncbi:MAG: hypothetical protein IPN38_02570 [Flavobacteriales bacterium]|nr:hypothetical protein [Flavobacteriales bacterium]
MNKGTETMERLGRYAGQEHQQGSVERMAREQYWPGTLMAFGMLTWIATFWWGQAVTFITYGGMFRWLAFFCFVGNLLPYVRSGLVLGMERFEWFMFNLLAVGPFTFSILLWFNFGMRGEATIYILDGNYSRQETLSHWRDEGSLPTGRRSDELSGRLTQNEELRGLVIGPLLGVSRGALGYEVIDRWETAVALKVEELR